MTVTTINAVRHNFNALHVYSKLIDVGFSKRWARTLSRMYEKIAHKFLYTSRMTISEKNRKEVRI
jgi:hypothetical protein